MDDSARYMKARVGLQVPAALGVAAQYRKVNLQDLKEHLNSAHL